MPGRARLLASGVGQEEVERRSRPEIDRRDGCHQQRPEKAAAPGMPHRAELSKSGGDPCWFSFLSFFFGQSLPERPTRSINISRRRASPSPSLSFEAQLEEEWATTLDPHSLHNAQGSSRRFAPHAPAARAKKLKGAPQPPAPLATRRGVRPRGGVSDGRVECVSLSPGSPEPAGAQPAAFFVHRPCY